MVDLMILLIIVVLFLCIYSISDKIEKLSKRIGMLERKKDRSPHHTHIWDDSLLED